MALQDWNINMLKTDLLEEFEDRLDNLSRLESLKKTCHQGVWAELKNKIDSGTEAFTKMVMAQA